MLPGTLPFVRLLQAFEMETVDSMGIGPITMPSEFSSDALVDDDVVAEVQGDEENRRNDCTISSDGVVLVEFPTDILTNDALFQTLASSWVHDIADGYQTTTALTLSSFLASSPPLYPIFRSSSSVVVLSRSRKPDEYIPISHRSHDLTAS